MKITTATCKEAIVEYCKKNKEKICNDFSPRLNDEDYSRTLKVKNWKREGKYICPLNSSMTVRDFKCDADYFDDALQAYVKTTDTEIIVLEVGGA